MRRHKSASVTTVYVAAGLVLACLGSCEKKPYFNEAQTVEPAKDSEVAAALYQRSDVAVEYVKALHSALAERKVELVVVAMPYWANLYPHPEATYAEVRDTPDLISLAAWTALHRLELAGIRTLDLYSDFHTMSAEQNLWEDDRWHLSNDGAWALGDEVAKDIAAEGFFDSEDKSKIVMMGECFALQFGKVAKARKAVDGRLEVLRAYGDRGRVPNLLFTFADTYLEDVRRVVWLIPYELLSQEAFPPLETSPKEKSSGGGADLFVQVKEGMGISNSKFHQMVKDLPYQNTISELRCTVLGGVEDLIGKDITLVGYTSMAKERLGLEHAVERTVLRVQAVDYDAALQKNAAIGQEYPVKTVEDFTLPRFWINEWSLLPTPRSSLSREMRDRLE
ncbi:MAG: hypothetical protein AAGA58_00455 [Verrucomicrobiota bacterium]